MDLKKTIIVIPVVALIGLAACTNPDGTINNEASGTAIGAATGAALGGAVSGKSSGAFLGGIFGAVAGNLIGQELDKQEAALREQLSGSGVYIQNTGQQLIVTLPEAITFAVDSAEVKSSLNDDLLILARNLNDYPNTTVDVVGHTDNTGTEEHNLSLSDRRAAAVRAILIQGGVSAPRIRAYGVGETQPIATNASAAGRQQNRRVEIYITPIRR